MTLRWRAIKMAACVALLIGSQASAQTFSAVEFREIGKQNLQSGNLAGASAVVDALLARNSNDVGALILGAQVAMASGDLAEGARLAKRAYWWTRTSTDSFVAARIAANSHAGLEQDSLAQLWLRRARQYSPNDETSADIARDYTFLRNRNPWSTQLSFGITPTSNVNGGGYGTINVGGLQFDISEPLPGFEIKGNLSTSYRIDSTETYATFLDLFANVRTYHLTEKANKIDPDATGSDYASGSIGVGMRHRQIFVEGVLPTDLSLRFAQNWSEGEVRTRTLNFGLNQRFAVSDDTAISVNLSNQYLIDNEQAPATSVGATTTWSQRLGDDRLRLSFSGLQSYSDYRTRDYTNLRVSGSYDIGTAFNGLNFGFDFEHGIRVYNTRFLLFQNVDREDATSSITLRVRNANIELYGFQPIVSLTATRVDSNINQFDSDFLSFGFDMQSSF